MQLEQKLAQERRARLAAEKLLGQKSQELLQANEKLAQHARSLSEEIIETKHEADSLRDQNVQVKSELAEVSNAYAIAERRLWDSLETIRDGFAVFDANNRMVAANGSYLSTFEGLEAVALGVHYDDIIMYLVEEGIVDTGTLAPAEWRAEMTERWRMDPIPNRVLRLWNGQYVKLIDRRTPGGDTVCLNLNMTEMMRMWAAVEAVPDGFVLYDHEDKLVMCNDRYRQIYDASAEAMEPGTPFEDILRFGLQNGQYTDAIGREEEWLAERLLRHRGTDGPVEQKLNNGRWIRVLEQRTPDGGLVGLRVDITEQKKQQQVLEDARLAAEGANRAKSAFLANMSHELRTPMNGVVGMSELLCDTELGEEQQLYAETIKNSGEALLALLNDVLDYSKIEADKLVLHPETFDLERAIHEVVMLLQATARDKEVEIYVDYDMFLPTCFLGDRGRIRQILTNLLGNAVKFTEKGHVLVRVVGFETGDPARQQIHLTVEDTGIGIDPAMQAHIFGEFNQVEDERNRKFEGTGLGLAITKKLVELMEGDIWVDSEMGVGSSFGIRLLLPIRDEEMPSTPALARMPKQVLIIDDHEVNRTILDRQLSPLGIKISACARAEDALELLSQGPLPGLVITDHMMPGMDGWKLSVEIRSTYPDLPILMLSSSPPTADGSDGPPVDLTLKKPAMRRQLYAAIEQICSRDTTNRAEATPPHTPSSESHDPESNPQPPATTSEQVLDILIAEDNRTNRLVVSKMLKAPQLSLRFAEDGNKAVAAYREQRPDLIFMDISMPGMDGKEATRAIRAIEAETDAPHLPIIALTAHALQGDTEEILAAGLDRHLTKPLAKAALFEVLEELFPDVMTPDGDTRRVG